MTTTIILVRHGQTEWNRVERFRGRADIPLNDTGMHQAEATGCRVAAEWRPVAIYASPLSRATQTAEAIGRITGLTVETDAGLVDIDYGVWEGMTPDEVRGCWSEMVEAWYHTPHMVRIPGGETLDLLSARAMNALDELVGRYPGQTIVLVSHTAINRIILLGVLGLRNDSFWRIRQEPCAINVFQVDAGEYTLVSMNDTCHLNGIFSS